MTARPPKIRNNGQRGFTLIEVLIATLLLAVGLLGLAGLQAVSLKMNHGSYLRSQATNLASEITDAMRANGTNAASYTGTFATTTCNPSYVRSGTVAAADIAEWRNRLACLLPAGSQSIALSGMRTTVTVTWNEEARFGGNAAQSFSFVTEL